MTAILTQPVTSPPPLSERGHRFSPRRVGFDYAEVPDHWIPGDPHTTHVMNVLHLLLPAGERWFVEVFRKALPLIEDEDLERDVKAFIGQEATHARAHTVVLDHLQAQGIDPRWFTRRAEWVAHQARTRTMWSWLPGPIRRRVELHYLRTQLGTIAAIEHFTSVLGWWIVTTRGPDRAGADPTMMSLVRWHGAEEVEHRSVAFDAYRAAGGGYLRRCLTMLMVTVGIISVWIAGTTYFMRVDPGVTRRRWGSVVHYHRAAKADKLPPARELLLAVPRYLAPRFHPSQEGRTQVAVDYLATADLAA